MRDRLFLDIENKLGHPSTDRLLVIGYAFNDEPVTAITMADTPYVNVVRDMLADPGIIKVEQTKHDARYLALCGWEVNGPVHDTTVMAHLMNENTPLDIDWLAWHYAGVDMDKRLKRGGGKLYFTDDDAQLYDLETAELWPEEVFLRFQEYCGRDVDALRKVYWSLWQRLDESEWLTEFVEERAPYTSTLLRMEARGLPVNVEAVSALAEEMAPEKDRLGAELLAEAGLPPSFNLNSGDQLAAYLFSRVLTLNDALVVGADAVACIKSCLDGEHEDCEPGFSFPAVAVDGEPTPDGTAYVEPTHMVDLLPEGFTIDKLGRDRVHGHWTVKGRGLKPTPPTKNPLTGELGKRPSTASPELLYMHAGDPWVKKLCLDYRKLEKLLTTYLTKWPVEAHEGRLYGRYNQTGTVTGRLSSSGPNLQNVPARGHRGKAVRGLFQGSLIVGDYDQLEMRLMAHFSEDREMLKVFREGRDPHLITAQGIFGMDIDPDGEERGIGKTLNFAMGYGAGPKKVAQVLSLAGYATTKDVAAGYLAEMAHFYRGFFRWKQGVMAQAKRKGNVRTIGGTRRRLRSAFKDTANWKLVGYGERQAVNAIIQGSAADIIRRSMVLWDKHSLAGMAPMLAQVHDEIVFEHYGVSGLLLESIQQVFEVGHGFDLRVPLLFVPHVGTSWAGAKEGADIPVDLMEDEYADS